MSRGGPGALPALVCQGNLPARTQQREPRSHLGAAASTNRLFFLVLVRVRDQQPHIRKLGDHSRGAGHGRDSHPQADGRFQHQQQTAQGG